MPRSRRSHPHHHRPYRDRSRLALLLSRRQRKPLLLFMGGCLVYGYAFFYCQPDRSFDTIQRQNDELKLRAKLRQDQLRAKRNGEDLDVVPEVADEAPEWQRKMRASAGEMAWKREQEQLAAAGHSNLRGSDGRRRGSSNPILDMLVMMSVFVITRTILRACLFYRQFNRMVQAQGGMPPVPTGNNGTPTTTTTTTRNTSNNPFSSFQSTDFASLIQNARFRNWVTQLNEQREQHGQPPLSQDTLRTVLRDSDFSGNDYDALMQFHEEATTQSTSLSAADIDRRCPARTLTNAQDDLLTTPDHQHLHVPSERHAPQHCAICLEAYQLHDSVRCLPCRHEFHVHCIDPWLTQKALCPICKHAVVVG